MTSFKQQKTNIREDNEKTMSGQINFINIDLKSSVIYNCSYSKCFELLPSACFDPFFSEAMHPGTMRLNR